MELAYRKPHELEWITNQENPLLLCIADRDAAAVDVYSTWNLLCGVLGGGWEGKIKATRITLRPGETGEQWPGVRNAPDGSQDILLGKPIIRITHQDIVDERRTKKIAGVMGGWVALDRINTSIVTLAYTLWSGRTLTRQVNHPVKIVSLSIGTPRI